MGDPYFKQKRVIQNIIKTLSLSYSLTHSKNTSYFHGLIVYILVPYAFQFSHGEIMVRFLITEAALHRCSYKNVF